MPPPVFVELGGREGDVIELERGGEVRDGSAGGVEEKICGDGTGGRGEIADGRLEIIIRAGNVTGVAGLPDRHGVGVDPLHIIFVVISGAAGQTIGIK